MKISILIIAITLLSCNCSSVKVSKDAGVPKYIVSEGKGKFNDTISVLGDSDGGVIKGLTVFNASDFDTSSGIITLDYDSMTAKPETVIGHLSQEDWEYINNQETHGYDTIKCIMLLSDTSDVVYNLNTTVAMPNSGKIYSTNWQYGYEVRKTNPKYHTFEGNEYLDEGKHLLKSEIVVWQSIRIR